LARQEPVLFIAPPPAGACFLAVSDFGSLTGTPEQLGQLFYIVLPVRSLFCSLHYHLPGLVSLLFLTLGA
jgi:hypothetical protein